MLNLASAMVMVCVGTTFNFKANVEVDMVNASVRASLLPLDQSSAPMNLNYDRLPRQGFCLANPEIKFCNSPLTEDASIEFNLDDGSGALAEQGRLKCQPK